MKPQILIDLGKLKDLHSGLGQVSLQFGEELVSQLSAQFRFTFLVPPEFKGYFGNQVKYEILSFKRRYFPQFCPKYDLWHAIHQDSAYLPGNANTPYLLTIHDLNFLVEKSSNKSQNRLKRLQNKVDRAQALSTISEFSASQIRRHLNIGKKELHVIYNGVKSLVNEGFEQPDFAPKGDFLFTIGVIRPKKNAKVLLSLLEQDPSLYVIIAGNDSHEYAGEIRKEALQKGLSNRVLLPGVITDQEKTWLYQHCKAFLFPSLLEGFGLPVIEALQFGKPVFISDQTSLPEISGKFAWKWSDFDPEQMRHVFKEGMKEYRSNPGWSEQALQHAALFNWNKNVQSYLKIYELLLTK